MYVRPNKCEGRWRLRRRDGIGGRWVERDKRDLGLEWVAEWYGRDASELTGLAGRERDRDRRRNGLLSLGGSGKRRGG